MDLKDIEAKIRKLDLQLNIVKTNKEYAALQHETLGLKADKSKNEDEILKMLEQTETQQKELKELARKAGEAGLEARERRKAIETALNDAEARIQRVRQERAALAATIAPTFLTPYERLLHKADGKAMAACRNYVCEGCRMSLTANTVNLLMAGERLIYCHSCGRILYIAENEDLTGVAAAGRKDFW
jgi:predicted  nucleic acid-binding Zn-ribbon protein